MTGAIIVSLGEEYAGLFSNNDELSEKLYKVGLEVNEKVWRLPLNKNYDKLINSSIADVQNINYSGGAGSITAAQFLQKIYFKKYSMGTFRYSRNGFFKESCKFESKWCNRIWG